MRIKKKKVKIDIERKISIECKKLERDISMVGKRKNVIEEIVMIDLRGEGKKSVEIEKILKKLRRSFREDEGNERKIVGDVEGKRLKVDNILRRKEKFIDKLRDRNMIVINDVINRKDWCKEMNEVIVGGDDSEIEERFIRKKRIGGDKVVRIEEIIIDEGKIEGESRM